MKPFLTIDNIESIKVIADERRLTLLRLLRTPRTVKELAVEMELPPAKLYYHMGLLEKHGFVQVVDTQIVSGIIEKRYQATAEQFRIRNPMLLGDNITPAERASFFGALVDETKAELQRALEAMPPAQTDDPPLTPFVSKKEFRLTQAQLTELHARLDRLINDLAALAEENRGSPEAAYALAVLFYPKEEGA